MGFEYKILTHLTDHQKNDIEEILNDHRLYFKKHNLNGIDFWYFKDKANNVGEMPNFTIVFESDGIYILKNDHADIWKDLEDLKEYFQVNKVDVLIKDYDE